MRCPTNKNTLHQTHTHSHKHNNTSEDSSRVTSILCSSPCDTCTLDAPSLPSRTSIHIRSPPNCARFFPCTTLDGLTFQRVDGLIKSCDKERERQSEQDTYIQYPCWTDLNPWNANWKCNVPAACNRTSVPSGCSANVVYITNTSVTCKRNTTNCKS